MRNFNLGEHHVGHDEWLTPPEVLAALGPFDLDPCAPRVRPWDMAKQHYTIEDNGLLKPWHGRVWLNPPYGKHTFRWVARLSEHKSGIALIFARTETAGFHKHVWKKARGMFFFRGRLNFRRVDGRPGGTGSNAPSVLIAYTDYDAHILDLAARTGTIDGHFINLSPGADHEPKII